MDARKARASARQKQQQRQQLQRERASRQPKQQQQHSERQMASRQHHQLEKQMTSQQHQQLQRQMAPHLYWAHHDASKVCRPDWERPFASLEDARERLIPYHLVADYEMEEDEKLLDSSATGSQILSRPQQFDRAITEQFRQLTTLFEKQVHSFNMITRKRALGDMRTEEKLMMETLLLQETQQASLESRAEKARRETHEATTSMFGSPSLVWQDQGFDNEGHKEPLDDC